jgi:hypothetical protein
VTEPNWDHVDYPPYGQRPLRALRCDRCEGIWWAYRPRMCCGYQHAPHDPWLMECIDRDGVPREQTPGLVVK